MPTARIISGKLVWDEPPTENQIARDRERFAEMCRSHSAPVYKGSDRAFMEGRVLNHGFKGDPDWLVEMKLKQAKRAGIDVTGKVYIGGLADGRGGGCPDAWVSGADDVTAACQRRNLNATGCVNYQGHEVDPGEDAELAPDIVEETVNKYVAVNPDLKRKDKRELREMVKSKHGNKASKGDSAGNF